MRFVITGGGTGGHVTPALAIAEAIFEKHPNAEAMFIGRKDGKENDAVKQAGIRICEINVLGIQRKLTVKNVKNIITAAKAVTVSKNIIRDFKPDFVVGTGGYVSWPVIQAATKMKIPAFIHESNAYPGLVTRVVGRKCSAVFLNFKEASKLLAGCKTFVVGNPVRKAMKKTDRSSARRFLGLNNSQILITSFGGSGGSNTINECVIEMMRLYKDDNSIRHIHATGHKYYEDYKNLKIPGCTLLPYIDNMPVLLAASDIVICRCGAMTLSEIATSRSAAILIPSPNVTNNHQYKNAKVVVENGGAYMLEEKDLTAAKLKNCVDKYISSPSLRNRVSKCIEKFANRDAAERIRCIIERTVFH